MAQDTTAEKKEAKFKLREYKGVYMSDSAEIEDFGSFKCRDDDVWVCGFPRSGTTLTQQITYLVMTLDFDKATTVDLDDRFPFADCCDDAFPYYKGLKHLDSLPVDQPRLIKSHFHHFLLPDELKNGKGRIVYITRNPKASVFSLFKLLNYIKYPTADSLREYIEKFLTGKDVYSSPWWLHVRQFWEHRNDENVNKGELFKCQIQISMKEITICGYPFNSKHTYMMTVLINSRLHKVNRRLTIKQIAEFLGRDLTEQQIDQIMEHTSLESMKNNNSVNFMYFENAFATDKTDGAFINQGEVSGWKRDIPDDLAKKIDEMVKRELGDTDLKFE